MSEQAKIGRKGSKHNENKEEGSGNAVNAFPAAVSAAALKTTGCTFVNLICGSECLVPSSITHSLLNSFFTSVVGVALYKQ